MGEPGPPGPPAYSPYPALAKGLYAICPAFSSVVDTEP